MQKGLVSIILPVYNAELYIEKCINTVIKQSYEEWELLLIDDGSTDNTYNVITQYLVECEKIKYFKLVNGGVSNARNYGLEKALGEYIFFLDADDFLEKDCLQKAVKASKDSDSDIVIMAHYELIDKKNRCVTNNKFNKSELICENDIIRTFLVTDKFGWEVWGKLYRRDLLVDITFDKTMRIAEDALFLCNALLKSKKVYFLKEYEYYYRLNANSVMAQGFSERNMDIIKAINRIFNLTEELYPLESRAFKMKYQVWFLRRYACKIKKEEKVILKREIDNLKKILGENTVSDAKNLLTKKYFVEFLMIKYLFHIYAMVMKILHKFELV